MRVISGTAKGHKLKCIEGINTRPTQDRVKESVFNILMNYIKDSNILDLFSGTGNLAIESLSRGARFAIMVDKNPLCKKIIEENLEHTKLQDKGQVLCQDVLDAIRKLKDKYKFDIIFMDPPYSKGNILPTLNEIFNSDILSTNGIIVIEREKKDEIEDSTNYKVVREQVYGNTVVSFLKSHNF